MVSKAATEALKGLSDHLQLPDLTWDSNQLCGILLENRYPLVLLACQEDYLCLYALLGAWPAQPPADFALELLTTNLWYASMQGPYMGYDPFSQSLLLADRFDLEGKTAEQLALALTELAKKQAHVLETMKLRGVTLSVPELSSWKPSPNILQGNPPSNG